MCVTKVPFTYARVRLRFILIQLKKSDQLCDPVKMSLRFTDLFFFALCSVCVSGRTGWLYKRLMTDDVVTHTHTHTLNLSVSHLIRNQIHIHCNIPQLMHLENQHLDLLQREFLLWHLTSRVSSHRTGWVWAVMQIWWKKKKYAAFCHYFPSVEAQQTGN